MRCWDAITKEHANYLCSPSSPLFISPIRFIQFLTNPEGKPSAALLIAIVLIFTYNILVIPFRIAFFLIRAEAEEWMVITFAVVDIIFDLVNLVEIALNMFAPFINVDGAMAYNLLYTVQNYVGSRIFWIDIVSAFPIDWFVIALLPRLIPVFRLNRLARLLRFNDYFSMVESKMSQKSSSIRILKLISIEIIVVHYFNCIFNIIHIVLHPDYLGRWTMNSDYLLKNVWQRYLYGMYWTLSTMTGYGSTIPVNVWQLLFGLCVVSLGFVLQIMIIGTVSSLIEELGSKKNQTQTALSKIDNYMKYRRIPIDLRTRIRQYHLFLQQSRKGWNEEEILDDLPQYMRMELAMNMNRGIIEKVPLFKIEGISRTFITSLVMSFIPRVMLPNTVIVHKGDIGREMFFIVSGFVEIILDDGTVVAKLGEGSFFGEVALINNVRRTATVRAGTFVDLYILTKDKFDEIASDYPDVLQGE